METNLKERLLLARKEILETKVVKQGKNKFSNYDYFTPSQITALVTRACINNKLLTQFSIEKEEGNFKGVLKVIDLLSDNFIEFTIPTDMPDIKATNVTQKLGGMVTYTQRYLEMVSFGITDNNLDLDNQDNTGSKIQKKTLNKDRFDNAIKQIEDGKYTIEELKQTFKLSEEQEAIVNEFNK